MILRSIRVRRYKNIRDSGEVKFQDGVTCLVGRNESGKSAILQALYRLNPLATGHQERFVALRDYPRRDYTRDQDGVSATHPVTALFELDGEDLRVLEDRYGRGVLASPLVTLARTYENELRWEIDYDEKKHLQHAAEEAGLDGAVAGRAGTWKALLSERKPEEDHEGDFSQLRQEYAGRDFRSEIRAALEDRLPRFLYFNEYSVMAGRTSIPKMQNSDERTLEPSERTALSLMRLAGADLTEFRRDDYEARRASLEAAANQLSDEVFKYWSQNPDLSVELDVDFDSVGSDAWAPFIDIRIRDQRHRITLNFSERSHGFTWFFSFLVVFSEFRHREKMILLLDEPGLGLHAAGQNDLLRFINEGLAPAHQVIYSTHSPFMIDPKCMHQVRTIEDRGRAGASVSRDFLGDSRDTLLPLQAALGYELLHSLLIGPDVLLVEGPSDHIFLTVMSGHLESRDRSRLDPRWVVVPAGGLAGVAAFLTLLGVQWNVAVLTSAFDRKKPETEAAPGGEALEEKRIVRLADFARTPQGGVEDLFAEDFYLDLANRSGAATIEKFELHGEGGVVRRIEAVTGTRLNRWLPARFLLEGRAELADDPDDDTLDRFEALFHRINGVLEDRGGGRVRRR